MKGVDLLDTKQLEDLRLDSDMLVNNAGLQIANLIERFVPQDFRKISTLMLEAPLPHTSSVARDV